MMMSRRRYCIFGCAELGAYMHNFPHPERRPELFRMWLSAVGDRLKETDPLKIYKNKRICDHHFTSDQKVASHRLNVMAVPSVNFNGVFVSPAVSVQLEHNYCLPTMCGSTGSMSRPNTSNISNIRTDEVLLEHINYNQPSTSQINTDNEPKLPAKKLKTAQNEIRRLRNQLRKSERREKSTKARLELAMKYMHKNYAFEQITKNMTLSGKIFTGIQYHQAGKKPKGRRYNMNEKIMSLSIYKRSPKCYNFLSKYFRLPSAKSLKNLLSKIKITPGINDDIFRKLKETVDGLNIEDKLCSLIFDEMSLTPHVQYNSAGDILTGFVSHKEDLIIANHVLVFMLKGIKTNFKQPVAYYFTQSLKTAELKEIIKEVVRQIQKTGLKIICTVCDQGATNVSAINSLVKDTKEKYIKNGIQWRQDIFEVDDRAIIPIYDVPHLLKGLRNNLLNKDLIYKDVEDNTEKVVKWRYFEKLYEADKSRGELRYLHKLTEEHIIPSKIKKMKVKMAAQVFSHSVAVTADHLTARGILDEECRQLIPFVILIDKLFDSLNAGTFHIPNGKKYRGAVKRNSPHHRLWIEAKEFLKNLKFLVQAKSTDKVRLVETSIPSVKNLIKTIDGVQNIWKILNQKYSLDCMLTRNLNQDPVENFFGNIRSLGVRNVSPNSCAFEGAFKTLLLNNFASNQSINSNCEEDFNACLQSLDFLLKKKAKSNKKTNQTIITIDEKLYEALSNVPTGDTSSSTQNRYVCGWVLTKCLTKIVKSCTTCRATLISNKENEQNSYIQAKEYDGNRRWLCYPSDAISNCFREIQDITITFLKTSQQKNKLKETIMLLTNSFVNFPSHCLIHKESLQNYFTETTVNILIFSWCRSINRILLGKITNHDRDDPIKNSAQLYYNTHKRC